MQNRHLWRRADLYQKVSLLQMLLHYHWKVPDNLSFHKHLQKNSLLARGWALSDEKYDKAQKITKFFSLCELRVRDCDLRQLPEWWVCRVDSYFVFYCFNNPYLWRGCEILITKLKWINRLSFYQRYITERLYYKDWDLRNLSSLRIMSKVDNNNYIIFYFYIPIN